MALGWVGLFLQIFVYLGIDPYPLVEHEFPNAFLFVDSNFYYDDREWVYSY